MKTNTHTRSLGSHSLSSLHNRIDHLLFVCAYTKKTCLLIRLLKKKKVFICILTFFSWKTSFHIEIFPINHCFITSYKKLDNRKVGSSIVKKIMNLGPWVFRSSNAVKTILPNLLRLFGFWSICKLLPW